MQEEAKNILTLIKDNYSFTNVEISICNRVLEFDINYPRAKRIIELAIKNKLDKKTIIAFLVFQLFKVNAEQSIALEEKLSQETKSMIANFKTIQDLNNLTASEEVEDVRRMFLVMGKDLRVVIMKLFGVYYDISILSLPLSESQAFFVKQVKEIHVPLSERLGLDNLKQHMNDHVVRLEHPEEYARLKETVETKSEENAQQLELTKSRISKALDGFGIEYQIQSRIKRISSIYNKLHNNHTSLDQIYDILAMRIIVDTVEECYDVLGIVHGMYKPMAGRVKDYIASPKPNGYQSLHTNIIVENQHPLDVQIRTKKMHQESEYGVYSHWLYKENKSKQNDLDKRMSWFREAVENAQKMSNEEFVETLKSDLYEGVLVVQTPKGRVLEFPEGSTVIDFAYAIHSDIGNKCVGAKINGKLKPFTTALCNGDIVEIITNPNSKGPSRDWLKSVKTASARSKIKSFFKNELKEENIKLGRSMFISAVQDKGYTLSQLLTEEYLGDILKKYNMEEIDELYASIGSGSLLASGVIARFVNLFNKEQKTLPKLDNVVNLKRDKDGVLIDGDSGMMVRFAGCCNPIEGDDIIGYISRGRGVTIHRENCPNLQYLEEERLVEARWLVKENATFTTAIKVIAEKHENNIGKLTNQITALKLVIKGFEVKDMGDNYLCTVVIEVKNKKDLDSAINSIRGLKNVVSVFRSEK